MRIYLTIIFLSYKQTFCYLNRLALKLRSRTWLIMHYVGYKLYIMKKIIILFVYQTSTLELIFEGRLYLKN